VGNMLRGNSAFLITEKGEVFAFGINEYGELGLGNKKLESTPKPIEIFSEIRIISICAGFSHSLALTDSGNVWSWGRNNVGQLGLRNYNNQCSPQQIPGLEKIVGISAGTFHNLAVSESGLVSAWGANSWGQLGVGDYYTRNKPKLIRRLTDKKIISIYTGARHSGAISSLDVVYAWGNNLCGQLGISSNKNRKRARPIEKFNGKKVLSIVGGQDWTLAIVDDQVYSWGHNQVGQLGLGDFSDRNDPRPIPELSEKKITRLGVGNQYSVAIGESGNVFVWGNNSLGELGNKSSKEPKNVPQAVENVEKIVSIVSGGNHIIGISEERKVYCWGFNGFGQLGIANVDFVITPQENTFFTEKNISVVGVTLKK